MILQIVFNALNEIDVKMHHVAAESQTGKIVL